MKIFSSRVKNLWRKALGDFKDTELVHLAELKGKRVVDVIHELAYVRTSSSVYPHHVIRTTINAKIKALKKLDIEATIVFDGIPASAKKRENERRQKDSTSSREQYMRCLDKRCFNNR